MDLRMQRMERAMEAILLRLGLPNLDSFEPEKASELPFQTTMRPVDLPLVRKSQPYKYEPLDTSKGEIRLVGLYGANERTDPIRVQVIHTSLDDKMLRENYGGGTSPPSYIALSYAWGDQALQNKITVDGCEFSITQNLESALRTLRKTKSNVHGMGVEDFSVLKSYYWVDQICINQSEIEERNSQITLMRHIYHKASSVRVWLGDEADESDLAMNLVDQIGKDWTPSPSQREVEYPKISSEQKLRNWKALHHFFQRSWWERSWIRQEVAMGRSVTLQCGNTMAKFEVVVLAAKAIKGVIEYIGYMPRSSSSIESYGLPYPSNSHAEMLQNLRSWTQNGSKFSALEDMLVQMRGCKTTDPRDKVYSILGLSNPETYQLVPDYRLPVREVFTSTARAILQYSSSIDILGACQNPMRRHGLPSWVPNLYDELEMQPLDKKLRWGLSATTWRKFKDDTFIVEGWLFDTVKSVSNDAVYRHQDEDQLDNLLESWEQYIVQELSKMKFTSSDRSFLKDWLKNPRKKEKWLSVLPQEYDAANPLRQTNGALKRFAGQLNSPNQKLVSALLPVDAQHKAPLEMLYLRAVLRKYCHGRKLMISKAGKLGLAPREVRVGDFVTTLPGCSSPYILRKAGVGPDPGNLGDIDPGKLGVIEKDAYYVLVGDVWLPNHLDALGSSGSATIRII